MHIRVIIFSIFKLFLKFTAHAPAQVKMTLRIVNRFTTYKNMSYRVSYAVYIHIRAYFFMKIGRTLVDFTAHACLGSNFFTFFLLFFLIYGLNPGLDIDLKESE